MVRNHQIAAQMIWTLTHLLLVFLNLQHLRFRSVLTCVTRVLIFDDGFEVNDPVNLDPEDDDFGM